MEKATLIQPFMKACIIYYIVLTVSVGLSGSPFSKEGEEVLDGLSIDAIANALLNQDTWAIAMVAPDTVDTNAVLANGKSVMAYEGVWEYLQTVNARPAVLIEQLAGERNIQQQFLLANEVSVWLPDTLKEARNLALLEGSVWLLVIESAFDEEGLLKSRYSHPLADVDGQAKEDFTSPEILWEVGDSSYRAILLQWARPDPAPHAELDLDDFTQELRKLGAALKGTASETDQREVIAKIEPELVNPDIERVVERILRDLSTSDRSGSKN